MMVEPTQAPETRDQRQCVTCATMTPYVCDTGVIRGFVFGVSRQNAAVEKNAHS